MKDATEKQALDLLERTKVSYQRFTHPPLHHLGDQGAPTDFVPMKNLLLKTKRAGQYYLYLTMQDRIDFGVLAKELNTSKSQLQMTSADELFDLMAVTPGTVNPFALENDQNRQIHFLVDQAIIDTDQVAVHPNQNEATIVMTWAAFLKVLDELGEDYQIIPS
ncbi:YbaK/EbsC family protein [Fructobacillus parabroussonetiae]|uniref:Prolyl-tRNA editing protein n=1 Tax=Fructobacillus parabroussonetiae TaxID=2713174 RepID=A0ABS5QWW9_9LACO|nr:YbaK/EbsC family protein [Fructobacillus parabroussonetiae]MBS9337701.1 prolyl-tRNA editing protein [Fructobacillus parabroussonetiae]